MWRATILTIFPDLFPGPIGTSLAGKALAAGLWALEAVDIRAHAADLLIAIAVRFLALFPDSADLREEFRHLHSGQSFKQRRNLSGHLRHIAGDLAAFLCVGGGEKGYQFGGREGARCGVTLWPAVAQK